MRHILLHYHLFKNAGSTVDAVLRGRFGEAWHPLEGTAPWDTLPPSAIARHAIEHPRVEAISSHQARLPLPEVDGITFHPILFLRHPIDRVGSVYEFDRRQPADSPGPGARVARERDLAGYVEWRLQPGNGATIRDFQTIHLSAREADMRVATATPDDLQRALDRLRALCVFGLVERFDESFRRIRAAVEPFVGPLGDGYSIQNRSESRAASMAERIADIEARLGPSLHSRLLAANAHDLALYESACRHFDGGDRSLP